MVVANEVDDDVSTVSERNSLERIEGDPSEGIEELVEFIPQLENYIPSVPDALAAMYLKEAGFDVIDPIIARIISVSAQKFISDIANDALQHCKTRTSHSQHSSGHSQNKDKKLNKDRKYTLATEDLTPALTDHGITMRKPQYFV